MNNDSSEIKTNIEEFQNVFKQYYKHFLDFYWAKEKRDNIYNIMHLDLVEDSIKLQVCFVKLPEILQKRLLEIDFEVFIHCNNVVDFYSFREYLYERGKHYTIATLVERVDAELTLAWQIADLEVWSQYHILPKRNLNFYRIDKHMSMLEENNNLKEDINRVEKEEINFGETVCNPQNMYKVWVDKIENVDDSSSKSMLDRYSEFIERSNNTVEKSKSFVKNITPFLKFLWDCISR